MQYKMPHQEFAVQIAVDDRERSSGVADALRRRPGVSVAVHRLNHGDYRVDDSLIVERKTLADFALSVRDGRLFDQVGRLARQQHVRTCLILEGTRERYPRLAIPNAGFHGALITVTLVFDVPVLRSCTPEETADLILYAANQLRRREVRPPMRRYGGVTTLQRTQSLLLQTIPEIGPKRAGILLEAFGAPSAVASAGFDELNSIEGIGAKSARKIRKVFHGRDR